MRLVSFLTAFLFIFLATLVRADEMATLGKLSQLVDSQCRRFYGVDSKSPIADLQQKKMSATDKLACAFPYAYQKVNNRLKLLEKLDPATKWNREVYVTLAARIYNLDFLWNTPRDKGAQTEILAVHPDLLILHRILRQTTPYALAFVFPSLGQAGGDFVHQVRVAAAGATEITPWSAVLRLAKGTDCYGPEKSRCMKNREAALQNLVQAIQLLSKDEVAYGYITNYSKTPEATGLLTAPQIRIANEIRKSISGDSIDYILGVRTSADWLRIRPDLRDTLNYLAASDADVNSPTGVIINMDELGCRTIFANLFALANEQSTNTVRQALKPFNAMEGIVANNPKLKYDGLKIQSLLESQDCNHLQALAIELNLHGVLSRFQFYQTRIFLISTHDFTLSDAQRRPLSRRYALISDVQRVIEEIQTLLAKTPRAKLQPSSSSTPKKLVDYISKILKEDPQ